jgi:hypothetical protein
MDAEEARQKARERKAEAINLMNRPEANMGWFGEKFCQKKYLLGRSL